jgi:hypothetical protein
MTLLTEAVGERVWTAEAACAPERIPAWASSADFFAHTRLVGGHRRREQATARALKVCGICPVFAECAAAVGAMRPVDRYGVWAGQVFTESDHDFEEAS